MFVTNKLKFVGNFDGLIINGKKIIILPNKNNIYNFLKFFSQVGPTGTDSLLIKPEAGFDST